MTETPIGTILALAGSMFASSIPAFMAAAVIAAGPPAFPSMLGDEPPPSVEDAWPFDEDPLIEEDDVLPEDDLLPEDDAWSAGDQGVASSGRSHEDEPLDEEAWPLAAEVMAPIEPSPTGEHVPPAIDGVAQDLHARWARLLPRLSIAVSRTYRDQDEAAGRSIELAVWLSLSWSLDARALQRSIP